MFKNGTSKHNPWLAQITARGKCRYLGVFSNQEDAARAYDEAAVYYLGSKAILNFPEEHDLTEETEDGHQEDKGKEKKASTPSSQGEEADNHMQNWLWSCKATHSISLYICFQIIYRRGYDRGGSWKPGFSKR